MRRGGFDTETIQGSVEGKRRRGRPATSWTTDPKKWTGQGMAAAARSAADRDRWRELVMTTAAQFVPLKTERTRDRERVGRGESGVNQLHMGIGPLCGKGSVPSPSKYPCVLTHSSPLVLKKPSKDFLKILEDNKDKLREVVDPEVKFNMGSRFPKANLQCPWSL